jgi:glycosyltransferase involved in cell wall biosynthesis
VHVLYLHQYFGTRDGVGGTRSFEFARHLVARGHTVTMVTARRADSGLADVRRQQVAGIEVVTLGGRPYSNLLSTRQRLVEFARFTVRATLVRGCKPPPDVVIATSTPITIGIPGVLLARHYGVPLVFEVRDLWPRAPIEMGVLRNRLAIRAARWLERWIYRNARTVIALSPGMQDGVLSTGVPSRRVVVIPNASDMDLFSPAVRDRSLLDRWGLRDRFVAVHAGSMGRINGLDYLIDAAAELARRGEDGIQLLILGDGGLRRVLEDRVGALHLRNVTFGGALPRAAVGAIVSSSDVAITSIANVPVLATASPNKFFDGLAAGIPALVNSPGWLRDLVTAHDAGSYVDVAHPGQLADALVRLRDDPELWAKQGRHARALARATFSRKQLSSRFTAVLEDAVGTRRDLDRIDDHQAPEGLLPIARS